jgi:hypothetical protein
MTGPGVIPGARLAPTIDAPPRRRCRALAMRRLKLRAQRHAGGDSADWGQRVCDSRLHTAGIRITSRNGWIVGELSGDWLCSRSGVMMFAWAAHKYPGRASMAAMCTVWSQFNIAPSSEDRTTSPKCLDPSAFSSAEVASFPRQGRRQINWHAQGQRPNLSPLQAAMGPGALSQDRFGDIGVNGSTGD